MARKRKTNYGSGRASLLQRMIDRPANISTVNALLWGLAWLIVGSILGWYFDLVPKSAFGYVWGHASLMWSVVFNAIVWISSTVVLFAAAVMRNRRVGVVDIFGRMLFAHWPVVLLMLPAIVGDKIAYTAFMTSPTYAFEQSPIYATLMTVIVVVILLWVLYWGYRAFSRATSKSGIVTFLVYAVAMVFAYWLSEVAINAVYSNM